MAQRILVVEDDRSLAKILVHNLSFEGYDVKCVENADDAAAVVGEEIPDLVLLDVALPIGNGFDLCRMWKRKYGPRLPIIILTAKSEKVDKIRGFNYGADDYVTKPFDVQELMLRVRAVARRNQRRLERLSLGNVQIDFVSSTATKRGKRLDLTHREFELLRYLAEREGQVVYRDELLREVWKYAEDTHTRAVDYAIVRLRRKIEPEQHRPRYIHTVYGDGYYLAASESTPPPAAP